MPHVIPLALTLIWIAANLYLWSMKQESSVLFWESLGMAAVGFPALFFYVTRSGQTK
jgi:hypothetical protein